MVVAGKSLTESVVTGGDDTKLIEACSIGQLIKQTCGREALTEAVAFPHESNKFLFSELLREVDRIAAGLLAIGLKPGQHVALWGGNHAYMVLTTYACCRAGLVFTNLNHATQGDLLISQLHQIDAKALVCFPTIKQGHCYDVLKQEIPDIETVVPGKLKSDVVPTLSHVLIWEGDHGNLYPGTYRLSDILLKTTKADCQQLDDICQSIKPTQMASIQFTSGATDEPKAVALSHHQLINGCAVAAKRLYLDQKGEVLCCPVPLFRVPVFTVAALVPFVYTTRVVYPSPLPVPPVIFQAVQDFKCTCIISNPIAFHLLLRLPALKQFDLSSLTSVCLAGEHMPTELIAAMQKNTSIADVTIGMFSTEIPSMPLMFPMNGNASKLIETVGTVADHYAARIVDETGKTVPVGKTGELQIKPISGSEFLGYYKDAGSTKKRFMDGWFLTGDMATMDTEGYVKLAGQKSDVIRHKKKTIYPSSLERYLNTHRLVIGSQVIGIGDPSAGEQLCLCVVPKERGSSDEIDHAKLKAELIELCKEEKLPEPDHVVFLKDFPRTLTKKVQKYKLKQMVPQLIKGSK